MIPKRKRQGLNLERTEGRNKLLLNLEGGQGGQHKKKVSTGQTGPSKPGMTSTQNQTKPQKRKRGVWSRVFPGEKSSSELRNAAKTSLPENAELDNEKEKVRKRIAALGKGAAEIPQGGG